MNSKFLPGHDDHTVKLRFALAKGFDMIPSDKFLNFCNKTKDVKDVVCYACALNACSHKKYFTVTTEQISFEVKSQSNWHSSYAYIH
jgi:hypothetical protein